MTLIDLYLTCAWTKTKANVTPYITNTFYKYFGSKHVNAGLLEPEPEGGGVISPLIFAAIEANP